MLPISKHFKPKHSFDLQATHATESDCPLQSQVGLQTMVERLLEVPHWNRGHIQNTNYLGPSLAFRPFLVRHPLQIPSHSILFIEPCSAALIAKQKYSFHFISLFRPFWEKKLNGNPLFYVKPLNCLNWFNPGEWSTLLNCVAYKLVTGDLNPFKMGVEYPILGLFGTLRASRILYGHSNPVVRFQWMLETSRFSA